MRYEAPLADCEKHALAMHARYGADDEGSGSPPAFTPTSAAPFRPDLSAYGIRDLAWFDVETIRTWVGLPRDHSHRPFIWVDTARGVLYAWWTD